MESWEFWFKPVFLIFKISGYNKIIQYKTVFTVMNFGGDNLDGIRWWKDLWASIMDVTEHNVLVVGYMCYI